MEPAATVLKLRTYSGEATGPHLLITGGVHGDEFEPVAAIRRLIGEVPKLIRRGRITLVPVVNEPAFNQGTRCGPDGKDLARVCPGSPHGTITERIAAAVAALIRGADYYIDLHTGGTRLAVAPMTGYCLHSEPQVLRQQRRMACAFNLPIVWGSDPNLEGRTLSVARDACVPAIYAEYGGSARCDAAGIEAYVQGCLNVMAELSIIDGLLAENRVCSVCEDARPGSGHMQACYPSPDDGLFMPAVAIGSTVVQGAEIGRVVDFFGDRATPVHAERAGIVLTLYTFGSVRAGDSLAVVLDADAIKGAETLWNVPMYS